MVQPQSTSLSFVLTAKYEIENKSSQYQYNTLPQHVFPFIHIVRFFYVGDEYRSTGRNVSTNFSRHSRTVHNVEIRIIRKIRMKKKNFCNQNDGKKM